MAPGFLINVIPRIAWRISNQHFFWSLVTMVSLWFFSASRALGWRRLYPVSLRYRDAIMRLYIFDQIDIPALYEIYDELYLQGEYDWKLEVDPTTIIDLGAHYGDTTLYYLDRYPSARIIAVDPLPDNVARLQRVALSKPAMSVVNAAVGSSDGEVLFHLTPSTLGASVIKRAKTRSSITVPLKCLDTILAEEGITAPVDLIKFDIEGAEFELFANLDPVKYARAYIGEVHCDFVDTVTQADFVNWFAAYDTTVIPVPGHEGHRFMFRATLK